LTEDSCLTEKKVPFLTLFLPWGMDFPSGAKVAYRKCAA
jgi:hypothetical protein